MRTAKFTPGVRLSILDAIVLVAAVAGTVVLLGMAWWPGFVVGFVVGHFFLFCNVFRIARPLELAWAGVFAVLAAGTIVLEMPGWPITTAASLAATVVVVVLEMRNPSYHGLGWRWINPGLPSWWEAHRKETPP